MKNQQITGHNKKSVVLTLIGIVIMILLTITKVVPSSTIAGYSVFVGIAFFFITETVDKTRGSESGLRFNTIAVDLKKPGVIIWMLLPSASGIATLVVGNMVFSGEFVAHVMERTSSILSFDKIALLRVKLLLRHLVKKLHTEDSSLENPQKYFRFGFVQFCRPLLLPQDILLLET